MTSLRWGSMVLGGLLWLSSPLVSAQTVSSCTYKPSVGQAGKDVVWVPTPDVVVDRMLRMAQVSSDDVLFDLGSGDGKIVIQAAQKFKVKGFGIEYNPDMVELSRCLAREAQVTGMVRFDQGDIFKSDFTQATVITMYLLPALNVKLRPILFSKMKPGTRIVSHQFNMGEWQPDETSTTDGRVSHFWVIPANAGGSWKLSVKADGGDVSADLSIDQTFQKIEGQARFGVLQAGLRDARLKGDVISFDLVDERGALRTFTGRITGDRMEGTAMGSDRRALPFLATRVGPAPVIRGALD
jgi:Methyltransferase domain